MAGSTIWAPVGDKGPTGDKGPPGDQGPVGPQGAAGPDAAAFAAFVSNLQNGVDPTKGTSLVGGSMRVVDNIAALRALPNTGNTRVLVAGYYSVGDGGGGHYYLDSTDTTSPDDGGSVIISTAGARWKLISFARANLKQWGAKGDNSTDDSAAFNAAITYVKTKLVALTIPKGLYILNTPATLTGRLELYGQKDATLIGNIVYNDQTFPVAADTATPPGTSAIFLTLDGVNFQTPNDSYALSITAQYTTSFIDCMRVDNCDFYGKYGMKAVNLIGVKMGSCTFYNTLLGLQALGCVNWTVVKCFFRQAAQYGTYIGPNPANSGRKGGENLRFFGCEWAVCATGIYFYRHQWGELIGCLFDYCILPVNNEGSIHTVFSGGYAGASVQATLTNTAGYIAPPTQGVAIYSHPYVLGGTVETCGIDLIGGAKFINYMQGSTQPVVYVEGNVSGVTGKFAERTTFNDIWVFCAASHSCVNLIVVSSCTDFRASQVHYYSPNLSTTLTAPMAVNSPGSAQVIQSDTTLLLQGGVELKSTFESTALSILSMVADANNLTLTNASGTAVAQFLGTGSDRVALYVGGSLHSIGVGAVNSGGTGFRQLIITNA